MEQFGGFLRNRKRQWHRDLPKPALHNLATTGDHHPERDDADEGGADDESSPAWADVPAVAVVFVAVAMLVGQGVGAGGLRTELMAEAVWVPDLNVVTFQPTTESRVVCDEGTNPYVACPVTGVLGAVVAAEATTYDRRAVAGQDYKPLKAVPVWVDGEGSTRLLVT